MSADRAPVGANVDEQLISGVRRFAGDDFAEALADGIGPPWRQVADRADQLSPREREILGLLGSGMSNRELSHALGLSEQTVKTHVGRILAKLGVRSRLQAGLAALALALAPGEVASAPGVEEERQGEQTEAETRVEPELRQDAADVGLDRTQGQPQVVRDLLVRPADRDQHEHLPLPDAQPQYPRVGGDPLCADSGHQSSHGHAARRGDV